MPAIPDRYDTIFKLAFADPELAGHEVRIRRTYGLIDSAADLVTVDLAAVRAGVAKPEDVAKLRQLVDEFADALVTWNLTDDQGQPLGTDRATLRRQDIAFVLVLIQAFIEGINHMAAQFRQQVAELDPANLPMETTAG